MGESFLVAEAHRWGIQVYPGFEGEEIRIIFKYDGMPTTEELETITPQGILLATRPLPRKRTFALATFPFPQHIPLSQARRYLSRDTGCLVMGDAGDDSVPLVQAELVDLTDGWYRDCKMHTLSDSDDLNEVLQDILETDTLQTDGIDQEAIRQLRILAKKMFGDVADDQQITICARRYHNQDLVFKGRGEDIHLFLRNDAVRKELGITAWTQRGYTATDRKSSSYFFSLISQNVEVELGDWSEMIVMYRDTNARTLTTVQPLSQFEREKQFGEEISQFEREKQFGEEISVT